MVMIPKHYHRSLFLKNYNFFPDMMCDGNKVFIMSLLLIGLCSLSQAEESAAVSAGRQPDNPSNQEPSAVEKEIVAPAFPSKSHISLKLPPFGPP